MPPMCATCKWYDPSEDDEGQGWCRAEYTVKGGWLVFPQTYGTWRCADWADPHITAPQRAATQAARLIDRVKQAITH